MAGPFADGVEGWAWDGDGDGDGAAGWAASSTGRPHPAKALTASTNASILVSGAGVPGDMVPPDDGECDNRRVAVGGSCLPIPTTIAVAQPYIPLRGWRTAARKGTMGRHDDDF